MKRVSLVHLRRCSCERARIDEQNTVLCPTGQIARLMRMSASHVAPMPGKRDLPVLRRHKAWIVRGDLLVHLSRDDHEFTRRGGVNLSTYISQGRRDGDALNDGEAQPVCLSGTMIRVLSNNNDAQTSQRCRPRPVIDVLRCRIHPSAPEHQETRIRKTYAEGISWVTRRTAPYCPGHLPSIRTA